MKRDKPQAQTVRPFTVAVLLMLAASRGVVASAQPSPLPPSAASNACATAVPSLPNDLPTAFAYELDSPGILGLISTIKALPARERTRVFNAVTHAAASPAERRLEGLESSSCPTLDDIYGTSRVLYLCVNEWKLREFDNAARFSDFSTVVATTVKALTLGDRVPPDDLRSALESFSASASTSGGASSSPSPQSVASAADCTQADTDGRTIHAVPPDTPPLAQAASTTGQVDIKLSLSDSGEVRSARIFRNTLRRGLGTDDCIVASILAAAASTFAPAIKACKPVASIAFFRVEFRSR